MNIEEMSPLGCDDREPAQGAMVLADSREEPAGLGQELLGLGPHVYHRRVRIARTLAGIDQEDRCVSVGCRCLEERGHADGERAYHANQQLNSCCGRVDDVPLVIRVADIQLVEPQHVWANQTAAGGARGNGGDPGIPIEPGEIHVVERN